MDLPVGQEQIGLNRTTIPSALIIWQTLTKKINPQNGFCFFIKLTFLADTRLPFDFFSTALISTLLETIQNFLLLAALLILKNFCNIGSKA